MSIDKGFLDQILGSLGSGKPTVVFSPADMVKELVAYGEPEAAERLMQLSPDEIEQIGELAHKHYSTFSGESGPMLDTAICLGIIEHLEGKPRALRRKRRVNPKVAK